MEYRPIWDTPFIMLFLENWCKNLPSFIARCQSIVAHLSPLRKESSPYCVPENMIQLCHASTMRSEYTVNILQVE